MEDKELLENVNTSSIYQITVKGKVGSVFLKSMNGMLDISVMLTPVSVILTPLAEYGSKNR